MTAHPVVGPLLALMNAPDEDTAERLIARLADPFTRRLARKQWRELQQQQVQQIGDAS